MMKRNEGMGGIWEGFAGIPILGQVSVDDDDDERKGSERQGGERMAVSGDGCRPTGVAVGSRCRWPRDPQMTTFLFRKVGKLTALMHRYKLSIHYI